MTPSLSLTAIAFSPCTTRAIINHCDRQLGLKPEEDWRWKSIKTGMTEVVYYRYVAALSAAVVSVALASIAENQALVISAGAVAFFGYTLSHSLGKLYFKSVAIHNATAPLLKISFMGVRSSENQPLVRSMAGVVYGSAGDAVVEVKDRSVMVPKAPVDSPVIEEKVAV